MANIQKPIAIPEPTNDLDSLWRTAQALKEAVEVLQGIRGNRRAALYSELQTVERDAEIIASSDVPLDLIDIGSFGWTIENADVAADPIFSATDGDTVAWSNATITTAAGTVYSGITAGNTSNMVARTFIYFDATTPTVLQTTTTGADAVGAGKILIAVAQDDAAGNEAFFHVFGGYGGSLLTANEIAANAITANEIAAGTITGAQISGLVITGKTLTADTGSVGGWNMTATALYAGSGTDRVGLDVTVTGGDDIRIYAGNETPSLAPFRVTESGELTASDAIITGAVTATSGSFTGAITASSGSFTGNITLGASGALSINKANSDDTTSGLWIGTDGIGGYDLHIGDATNYLWWDDSTDTLTINGALSGSFPSIDLDGEIPFGILNIAAQGWHYDGLFSAVDADTVQWASGTFETAEGTTYSITGADTGNMVSRTYIYFDIGQSTTVFQTTTTASNAVGSGKVLVAVADPGTDNPFWQVYGGAGGIGGVDLSVLEGNLDLGTQVSGTLTAAFAEAGLINTNVTINADGTLAGAGAGQASLTSLPGQIQVGSIAANAVTAGTIASLAVTAGTVAAGVIDTDQLAANAVTAGKIFANTITANEIAGDTITANEIAGNTITASEIDAGTITATEIATNLAWAQEFNVTTGGYFRSGQTAYDTGIGWWMEYNGGSPRFSLGNSAANKLTYSGGNLTIVGNIGAATYGGGQTLDSLQPAAAGADVTAANTAAAIAGQGDLATQNTADWQTDVTGIGKPTDNADVTSANTANDTSNVAGTSATTVRDGAADGAGVVAGTTNVNNSSIQQTGVTQHEGAINAFNLTNALNIGWTITTAFSKWSSGNGIEWASGGTFTANDGTSLSVTSGNTGAMTPATRYYIYIDIADEVGGSCPLTSTTTATTAIGTGKLLIGVGEYNTGVGVYFQVLGGRGGGLITANEIAANTITANQIAATLTWTGNLDVDTAGAIYSGQTAYDTGSGYWLEANSGTPRFSIGNGSDKFLRWTGSALEVSGDVSWDTASEGSFTPTSGQWTGFKSGSEPTDTLYYIDAGLFVVLYGSFLGTTTTAAGGVNMGLAAGTVPTAIRPSGTRTQLCMLRHRGSDTVLGVTYVYANGQVAWYVFDDPGSGAHDVVEFTAALYNDTELVKGSGDFTVVYAK